LRFLSRRIWTLPGFAAMGLGLAMAWALGAHAQAGPAASLTIRVENLSATGGILRLGLYDRAHYPDDNSKPVASADVKVTGNEMVINLHGIAPGTYAIETFQDLNANGQMDMTWLGFPEEPFGFSRDIRPHLRKPSFNQVAFTLAPGENMQVIHLQTSVSIL
jgi:uncharacterized protein (DUF2141 family)